MLSEMEVASHGFKLLKGSIPSLLVLKTHHTFPSIKHFTEKFQTAFDPQTKQPMQCDASSQTSNLRTHKKTQFKQIK